MIAAAGIALIAFALADNAQVKKSDPDVFVCRLPFGFRGMCVPPIGVFIDERWAFDQTVLAHELAHWRQYQRCGSAVAFGLQILSEYLTKGYEGSSLEAQARNESKEIPECVSNYTSCYR